MTAKIATWLTGVFLFAMGAMAEDWPQLLGPGRNGVYSGTNLARTWPADGPPVIWHNPVGQGFSGPVVAAGKLILFTRENDDEIVTAFDASTGKSLWHVAYPTGYRDDFGFDPGPRSTPCIANGRIYTLGAEGMIQCLNLSDGKKVWQLDAKKQFQARKGFFGIACSPLVEGNAVLVNIGGVDGAGIVALDQANGKLLWKASSEEASYSSPVATTLNGRRCALFLTRKTFIGLDPASGAVRFTRTFGPRERNSVTAATPVVVGDLAFLSGCYGAGATVVRMKDGPLDTIWMEPDTLSNHYATSIHRDGFLYGVDGRTDPGFSPTLRCIDFKTGKRRWEDDTLGAANLTLAGDELLILTEKGELIRAPATPEGFKPGARAQILSTQARAYPALANGFLYARSKDQLVCVDLAARK